MVDMWALGITIFKLMAGFTPFESEYHSDTIENIMKADLVFPPHIEARFSKQARKFVSSLLRRRNERVTAAEAVKDLWFIDICLLYTSPSPRDQRGSRMPSSA